VQHAATPTHSQTRRPVVRRLAWLGLGLVTTAFAVFEVAKRTLARGQLAPAAVPFYNAVHRLWGPLALLVACTFWIDSAALFTGGLAWLAHVAIDRATGFGLRTRDGFQRG
jgi:hypothetical protein